MAGCGPACVTTGRRSCIPRSHYLRRAHLAGRARDHADGVPGVIDEQLPAGAMRLAHDGVDAAGPVAVTRAELGVLEPRGLLGFELLPQERERHAFASQLGVNVRPRGQWAHDSRRLRWQEQQRLQRLLTQALRHSGSGQPRPATCARRT